MLTNPNMNIFPVIIVDLQLTQSLAKSRHGNVNLALFVSPEWAIVCIEKPGGFALCSWPQS